MRRRALLAALAVLVVVSTLVLAGVAWNRSGQSEASLALTERELRLVYQGTGHEENSGIALALSLHKDSYAPEWLDEDKLRELGFRPDSVLLAESPSDERYKQPLARRAWVVLEFDGPAWQAALERREKDLEELRAKVETGKATLEQVELEERAVARMKASGSRLVAVNAGRDAAELRARYPDRTRYLIVSAGFRMRLEWAASEQEPERDRVQGTLAVLGRRIHVPLQFHKPLLDAVGDDLEADYSMDADEPPHYSVTLNVGKRYEPWVAGVARLAR
jgi:hypothetical protein